MRLIDHTECHYVGTDIGGFNYYMRQKIVRKEKHDLIYWYAVIEGSNFKTKKLSDIEQSDIITELEKEFQNSDIYAALE